VGDAQRTNALFQPPADDQGPRRIGVGQDARKLLAAVARHHIGRTIQAALQCLGSAAQAVIARLVPVEIVEALEEVDVEQQQRQRRAVAPRTLPLVEQSLVEVTPVEDAREAVDEG
jgi:hypothetical protein